MTLIEIRTKTLPTILTQQEILTAAMELANTVQAMGTETEIHKNLKDQMKAKLSELQARQTRLSIIVATGKEYREVEVAIQLDEHGLIQEIRRDTGEVVTTRPPSDHERQMTLTTTNIA